jgi:hypothetical protein
MTYGPQHGPQSAPYLWQNQRMIYESGPWKERLLSDARKLAGFMQPTRTPLRRSYAIERSLFLAAFTMRKLWESNKLSRDWKERAIPCWRYKLMGDVPTILDRHDLAEFYDLKNRDRGKIEAPDLCNLLIHSFVFVLEFRSDGGLAGMFVASDRSRHGHLLRISARDLGKLLEKTGVNYPKSMTFVRNTKGQFDVEMGKSFRSPRRWRREGRA